jgi:gliding motility-associated-like protein
MEIAFEGELPKDWTIDWIIDGNTFSSKQRVTGIEVTESGFNTVSIHIRNEENAVIESSSKQIKIYALEEVNFSYIDVQDPYSDLRVDAEVKENFFSNYRWINEEGKVIGNGKKLSYNFEQKGVYDLALVATSKEGCEVKTTKPVSVQIDFDPLAPNAFTPNQQDGTNDIFRAEAFTIRDDRFKMEVYNLQGEMIFRSSDNKDGWNGRFNNIGQMMPAGIYIWKVMISNEIGQEKSFAGNVRLMK